MGREPRENSVKSLTTLYTVVIGIALSRAVLGVVDADKGLASVTLPIVLLFLAFIATLVPFFHGALRHLDEVYVENKTTHIRDGALVIDFVLLFVHALAFVVLSLLLAKPGHFAWALVTLLSIDVMWGIFVIFGSSSKTKRNEERTLTAEQKWTIINFVFVGAGITFLVWHNVSLAEAESTLKLAIPISFACILRSVIDYTWCKSFYFPK